MLDNLCNKKTVSATSPVATLSRQRRPNSHRKSRFCEANEPRVFCEAARNVVDEGLVRCAFFNLQTAKVYQKLTPD